MNQITRRNFLGQASAVAGMCLMSGRRSVAQSVERTGLHGMRKIPANHIFTDADTPGAYHHSAGIVSTKDGLVCVYRTSDQHVASWVNINMARSHDGGRSWGDQH